MKKIISAIDFSKNSLHALDYAIFMANRLEADICMVWVDASSDSEAVYERIETEIRQEKKGFFHEIIQEYQPKLKKNLLSYRLCKGKIHEEIARVAAELNADYIFAGTHGVSGYDEFWIGSHAFRIVAYAPCPVFSIPGAYVFPGQINNIVLPIDSSLETQHKLPIAIELSDYFETPIQLLLIKNSPSKIIQKRMETYAEQAKKHLELKHVSFDVHELYSENVAHGILEFCKKQQAGMICIMREQGLTSHRKYLGPYAQQLINNSEIPVLSLSSPNPTS